MGQKLMGKADALQGLVSAIQIAGTIDAEQLDFLPASPHAQDALKNPRGGRPAGSINKSTAQWARFILERYPSPLIFLAETYSRPVEELAAELKCAVSDAFDIQRKCAESLAPYVHSKMPVAVQVEAKERALVLIGNMSAEAVTNAFTLPIADYEEIQGVSNADAEKSDEAKVG